MSSTLTTMKQYLSQYTITLAHSQKSLVVSSQEILLTALEKHQLPLEYQCRVGDCGACRLQRLQGEVYYPTLPLASLQTHELLPCCCYPLSDLTFKL